MERAVLASGLFRSGTNYLQALVDGNLKCAAITPSPRTGRWPQKHASRPAGLVDHYQGLCIALIHKPPVKWVDSIMRQSFDLIDYYDLRYEPGHTVIEIAYDDEHHPLPDRPLVPVSLEKLCDHYNRYHRFWMRQAKNWPFVAVMHSRAAFEPEATLTMIAEVFDLARYRFVPVIGPVAGSEPFKAELYRNLDAFTHLRPNHIDIINRRMDADIVAFLGYERPT